MAVEGREVAITVTQEQRDKIADQAMEVGGELLALTVDVVAAFDAAAPIQVGDCIAWKGGGWVVVAVLTGYHGEQIANVVCPGHGVLEPDAALIIDVQRIASPEQYLIDFRDSLGLAQ